MMRNAQPFQPGWLKKSIAGPLKSAFAVAVMTALVVIFIPNQYQSTAKVLPSTDRQLPALAQMAALAPMLGLGGLGQDSDAINGEVLTSWWLHQRLLETQFRFHQSSWRFGAQTNHTMTWREYLKADNLDEAIQFSRERVVVRKDIKTHAITIEVETRSAELSQAVVRRTLALLNEFLMENGNARGSIKARFAEARLKEAEASLAQAEDSMKRWLQNGHSNYLSSVDPTIRLEGAHMERLLAMGKQQFITLTAMHEQALLEEKSDIPTLNVLDEGNLPERKSRPHRAVIVLACFALVFLGDWLRRMHPALRASLDAQAKP